MEPAGKIAQHAASGGQLGLGHGLHVHTNVATGLDPFCRCVASRRHLYKI